MSEDFDATFDATKATPAEVAAFQARQCADVFESGFRPMPHWTDKVRSRLENWRKGIAEGRSTGLKTLDGVVRLINGELTLVAARPSMGKCLGKGTLVLMHNGALKPVEEIQVGDQLMGPDSTPRNVLSLARGQEMMYWIHQKHGVSYRVNESHILSVKRSKTEGPWHKGDVLNIPVREAKDKGPSFFHRFKGYKVAVEFSERETPVDPYFLGIWLGDGNSRGGQVYTVDREVVDYVYEYAALRGETVVVGDTDRPCPFYRITREHKRNDLGQYTNNGSIHCTLQDMGLILNKHIPQEYLINSRANRLRWKMATPSCSVKITNGLSWVPSSFFSVAT